VAEADLAQRLTNDFNTDLKSAKQFDAKSWPHARSFDGKINEWFWSFFGEIF
jgi:hypothetical protein